MFIQTKNEDKKKYRKSDLRDNLRVYWTFVSSLLVYNALALLNRHSLGNIWFCFISRMQFCSPCYQTTTKIPDSIPLEVDFVVQKSIKYFDTWIFGTDFNLYLLATNIYMYGININLLLMRSDIWDGYKCWLLLWIYMFWSIGKVLTRNSNNN